MKEAYLYEKLKNHNVRCLNCSHYCHLSPDQKGICGVRQNIDGKLYSLNYGQVVALNIDPIEKKPLFHFLPGSLSLSLAAVGCNFKCLACQNWEISQAEELTAKVNWGEDIAPEEIVKIALKNNIPSISYTYTEPTVFLEYALDTMKLAKEKGLKNIWVSNGYMSPEALELISPYLDATNIDLKGFNLAFYRKNCSATLEPVLNNLIAIKKKKIWLEITTLVIPGLNDDEESLKGIAQFIAQKLGRNTPWHISQFSGTISWKLQYIEDTPVETLEKAYQLGRQAGLHYVYIGNVLGEEHENTYCPKCGTLVIGRQGYYITRKDIDGHCPSCHYNLHIIN